MKPNKDLCVNSIQPKIEIVNKPRMTFDELLSFIEDYNKENSIKKTRK